MKKMGTTAGTNWRRDESRWDLALEILQPQGADEGGHALSSAAPTVTRNGTLIALAEARAYRRSISSWQPPSV